MIEHGITTTKAHYWLHFFPLKRAVFWYRVAHCRAYIERCKVPETIGRSKDNAPTGGGYLVPQNAYFVNCAAVPERYLAGVNWPALTDREAGFLGQDICLVLIEHRVVAFPPSMVSALESREAQYDATDCQLRRVQRYTVELKTERVLSNNLFVQRWEAGHRVHLTSTGVRRVTPTPLFRDDEP